MSSLILPFLALNLSRRFVSCLLTGSEFFAFFFAKLPFGLLLARNMLLLPELPHQLLLPPLRILGDIPYLSQITPAA